MEGRVHNQVAELLSAYIDGEVSAAERALVERHLATCPTCTRDLAALRQTVQLLRQLPVVAPPLSFTLRESQVRPHRPAMWQWLFGAPALAGGLVTLLCVLAVGGVVLVSRLSPGSAEVPVALAPAPTRTALTLPMPQVVTVMPTAPAAVVATPAFEAVPPIDTVTLPAAATPTAVASPTEMTPAGADEFSAAANQPPTESLPMEAPTLRFHPAETSVVPPPTPIPPTATVAPTAIAEGVAPTEAVGARRAEASPTTEPVTPMAVMPATAPTDQPTTELALKGATTEPTAAAARDIEASAEVAATDTPQPPAPPTPEPMATETPQPPAPPTPESVATDTPQPPASPTPEPMATDTPQPPAPPTPEPTATDVPATAAPEAAVGVNETEPRAPLAESAPPAGSEGTAPEEPTSAPPPAEEEVAAPAAVETSEVSTPWPGADGAEPATAAPLTPTPVPMKIEELQLSVKPGVIRISGRLPLPEGQRLQAELWRADERLEWSLSQPKEGPVAVQAEGHFDLVLQAEPNATDFDLFAMPPAEYEVRIVPVEPPAALEARIPFNTFPPPTPEPK